MQVETTGHQWDDEEGYPLKELNNPLPTWWLYGFYATILWAVVYWVLYPAWPLANGFTKGILGWSQYRQLQEELDEAAALQKPLNDRLLATPLEQIALDPGLREFAVAGGRSLFGINCAPCHGSGGGGGGRGFPSLADDDWLYGGTLADIAETINDGRGAMMPAHLASAGGLLQEAGVRELVEWVWSLSRGGSDQPAALRGKALYLGEAGCNNCHGDHGKGAVKDMVGDIKVDKSVGAPNLTDVVWLYGGSKEEIYQSIAFGRSGKMPAWGTGFSGLGKPLDPLSVKKLTFYVHSLGGGQ